MKLKRRWARSKLKPCVVQYHLGYRMFLAPLRQAAPACQDVNLQSCYFTKHHHAQHGSNSVNVGAGEQ